MRALFEIFMVAIFGYPHFLIKKEEEIDGHLFKTISIYLGPFCMGTVILIMKNGDVLPEIDSFELFDRLIGD